MNKNMSLESRRLYLHVGPPKTGTSAIQHVLRSHDDKYVLYPKVGLWSDGSHHNLVFNFFGDRSRPESIQRDFNDDIELIVAQSKISDLDIVISSEALFNRDISVFANTLASRLHILQSAIEVIVVCREHFARASSLYNQAVKDEQIRERRDPTQYLIENQLGLCYGPHLDRLSTCGFRIKLMNYHPENTFVERFLHHVGFPLDNLPPSEQKNISLSPKALVSTLAANRIAVSAEHRRDLFETLRRMRGFYATSTFIFDTKAASNISKLFKADLVAVEATHQIKIPEPSLPTAEHRFSITRTDLADITTAVSDLGSDGNQIVEISESYLASEQSRDI